MRQRIRGRDMHRDLTAERSELVGFARRLQRDDHAHFAGAIDHGIVDIARDNALADLKRSGATQRHVFADGGDRIGDGGLDGDAADLGGLDLLDIGADARARPARSS